MRYQSRRAPTLAFAASLLLAAVQFAQAASPSNETVASAASPVASSGQTGSHSTVHTQPLPQLAPAPPYADRDEMARQPTMQELGLSGHVELAPLLARADRKPADWRLQGLVAQMQYLDGDRVAGDARYLRAIAESGDKEKALRHLLWSRGWSRLYTGDEGGALNDWREAARLHGGKPEWYPHTLALAYWQAGDRPTGLLWFEASQVARHAWGRHALQKTQLPFIAQSLLGDIVDVRDARADPRVIRLPEGSPEFRHPSYLLTVLPRYPATAVAARIQGRVMAKACVNSHGKVTATEISRSSGHRHLDDAVTAAIPQWQFRPASCGGRPRDSWVHVPVEFDLVLSGNRRLQPDRNFFKREYDPDVALDASGYRLVARSCDAEIVCSAGPHANDDQGN